MTQHRWSGWPGAWCLDCGASDPLEQSIPCPDCNITPEKPSAFCKSHQPVECTEPGSGRYDPYKKKEDTHD